MTLPLLLLAAEPGNESLLRHLLEAGADTRAHAPQLRVGGAAELAEYKHHETIAARIHQWSQKNAALIPRP